MRRKNFILTMLMFLFISILSIAVENPTTLSDNLGLVDPAYQEALKDYKPNLENIDKIFNYIEFVLYKSHCTVSHIRVMY